MTSRLKVGARPNRQSLRSAVNYHLEVTLGKSADNAAPEDYHLALALAIREPVIRAMNSTEERVVKSGAKQIHYLSMEFLIGRLLSNNLRNLGLYDTCAEVASVGWRRASSIRWRVSRIQVTATASTISSDSFARRS